MFVERIRIFQPSYSVRATESVVMVGESPTMARTVERHMPSSGIRCRSVGVVDEDVVCSPILSAVATFDMKRLIKIGVSSLSRWRLRRGAVVSGDLESTTWSTP